jgi:putative colanic acid biosynthesis UDP-glucose lipid carrier transferase
MLPGNSKPQSSNSVNKSMRYPRSESWLLQKMPGLNPNGIAFLFVASRKRYLFFKRSFDIAFSLVVILGILSWLIPIVSLAIFLDSGGPVFFRQKRVGKGGKLFYCIKFRTMRPNEEADERPAARDDDRITGLGKFLRLANIDELPQFFNVLWGQMSVIGPRPHMITDCIRFSFVISSYSFRNLVRPGFTGWAQVKGYHGPVADYESIIQRYYWDAMYINKISAAVDGKIMAKTFWRSLTNLKNIFVRRFQTKANTCS